MGSEGQVVEAIGEGHAIAQFLREGFEVARPVRDRGVDLVAYRDTHPFEAYPVQLKTATGRSFGIWKKYASIP